VAYRTNDELTAGLDVIRESPTDGGTLELIVRRPAVDEREVLTEGTLDPVDGLVGDGWRARGSRHTDDGSAEVGRQLTLMNARAAALIAGDREHWPLAGDQLFVDFDLSQDGLPPGTRVRIGEAIVEVTEWPHTGCAKFSARFGPDALRFANSPVGRELNLRGRNTRVIEGGTIRTGDVIKRV